MCGLTGFLIKPAQWSDQSLGHLHQMAQTMFRRGPDDQGIWLDPNAGIALAHRRLAVLDLSDAGKQPMISNSGQYVLALNGEIYNHLELRQTLESLQNGSAIDPQSWRGHSDTETVLAAFDVWGIEATLQKLVGMFAMVIWDRQAQSLTLTRDRLGEKPLYYGWVGNALVFGSELKPIKAFPSFNNELERQALTLYMRHNYIPAPWSIYQNIWKLAPGCLVQFDQRTALQPSTGQGNVLPYWSLKDVAQRGLSKPFTGTQEDAADELERLIRQSLRGQMIADVPLGAFLSGGYDSSTVTALMQSLSESPVKTFTIGFEQAQYNEAQHAKAVAQHLGTDHTEWYLTPQDALNVIPSLPELYDEPFADSSQIPTHLVCQLAKRHVTVALSGDAGDELFGGYNRYFWANAIWNKLNRWPKSARHLLASSLTGLAPNTWDKLFETFKFATPKRLRFNNPGDRLHKASSVLRATHPEAVYLKLISHWDDPEALVIHGQEPLTPITNPQDWLDCPDFAQRMMYLDACTYLPDDILVKVDRAAMGVSLETRTPFLDHRIVEFAWQLPLSYKMQGSSGKKVLRDVLYRHVPQSLVERPKMGFGVPIDTWLRGPLKEWAQDLLSSDKLRSEGYLNPEPIEQKWREHLSGSRNWAYHLWDILMFQAWLDTQRA
ncbi:asparagine synthase (glutamine-hydrolyzing) [Orrella sp. 11846]|uniref:asparagine synthase (glutamine-hydrolyzing) n=1 Tax=Orrella sp. 11846 TaxID=3409913 RepID=UPI003B5C9EE7